MTPPFRPKALTSKRSGRGARRKARPEGEKVWQHSLVARPAQQLVRCTQQKWLFAGRTGRIATPFRPTALALKRSGRGNRRRAQPERWEVSTRTLATQRR